MQNHKKVGTLLPTFYVYNMILKYIYLLLFFAPLLASAQNTEKEQLKEISKMEGLSDLENFLKPYREKLEEISLQKPKIANTSNFTVEERNAYVRHFQQEKKAKNDIELAKFSFIEQNKTNNYTPVLIAEKLNGAFEEANYKLLETFYNGLDKTDKDSEKGKKLASFLKEYANVQIGSKVTDFTLPDIKRKDKTLYKNLGKYTIIDFWASWCAPCRQENPNIVELYGKYQKKGLKIIGVSLDTDEQKWISAIEKDNLTWLQLSNLIGWKEPLVQHFKIASIPKLIIVDKNGIIVDKDLRGKELADKLKELFE